MSPKICKSPNCEFEAINSGFCRHHYNAYAREQRRKRQGLPEIKLPQMDNGQDWKMECSKEIIRHMLDADELGTNEKNQRSEFEEAIRLFDYLDCWYDMTDLVHNACRELFEKKKKEMLEKVAGVKSEIPVA